MSCAEAFWVWFERSANQVRDDLRAYHETRKLSQLIAADIERKLQEAWPGLVHEVGQAADDVFELIVSADGILERFPSVIECVKAAPRIPGWRVIAFRPRRNTLPESLTFEGSTFSQQDFLYVANLRENRLDIDVLFRGTLPIDDRRVVGASFIFLDCALGEYDVTTRIGRIEHRSLPPDTRASADALDLTHLVLLVDRLDAQPSTRH